MEIILNKKRVVTNFCLITSLSNTLTDIFMSKNCNNIMLPQNVNKPYVYAFQHFVGGKHAIFKLAMIATVKNDVVLKRKC